MHWLQHISSAVSNSRHTLRPLSTLTALAAAGLGPASNARCCPRSPVLHTELTSADLAEPSSCSALTVSRVPWIRRRPPTSTCAHTDIDADCSSGMLPPSTLLQQLGSADGTRYARALAAGLRAPPPAAELSSRHSADLELAARSPTASCCRSARANSPCGAASPCPPIAISAESTEQERSPAFRMRRRRCPPTSTVIRAAARRSLLEARELHLATLTAGCSPSSSLGGFPRRTRPRPIAAARARRRPRSPLAAASASSAEPAAESPQFHHHHHTNTHHRRCRPSPMTHLPNSATLPCRRSRPPAPTDVGARPIARAAGDPAERAASAEHLPPQLRSVPPVPMFVLEPAERRSRAAALAAHQQRVTGAPPLCAATTMIAALHLRYPRSAAGPPSPPFPPQSAECT